MIIAAKLLRPVRRLLYNQLRQAKTIQYVSKQYEGYEICQILVGCFDAENRSIDLVQKW